MTIVASGLPDGTTDPSLVDYGKPSDEVLNALTAGVVRVRRRVEIYEPDAITPYDIDNWNARLVDGTVTVDRERDERRMCDFTLENNDGQLINDPNNGFWYDKILKAFWGIRYYDAYGVEKHWETQIGEFMIDRIDEDLFPNTIKVTGRDYTKKCLVSKLSTSMTFPQYTKVEDILTALASNAGVTKIDIPFTGQVYTDKIVFERGTERWKVMKQVADTVGMEPYFRPDGYLTMKPYPDPTFDPLRWTFAPGDPDGTLVKYTRSSNDTNLYNHLIVVGSTTEIDGISESVFSERMNTNPFSPTRIDRIGDRVKIIQSDYITDQGQADNLADQLLAINALEEYQINFESVMLPWLEAGDIVGIIDDTPDTYTPKRFLLSQFSLPMKLGSMSGVGRRITIVGSK